MLVPSHLVLIDSCQPPSAFRPASTNQPRLAGSTDPIHFSNNECFSNCTWSLSSNHLIQSTLHLIICTSQPSSDSTLKYSFSALLSSFCRNNVPFHGRKNICQKFHLLFRKHLHNLSVFFLTKIYLFLRISLKNLLLCEKI